MNLENTFIELIKKLIGMKRNKIKILEAKNAAVVSAAAAKLAMWISMLIKVSLSLMTKTIEQTTVQH